MQIKNLTRAKQIAQCSEEKNKNLENENDILKKNQYADWIYCARKKRNSIFTLNFWV